MDQQIQQSIYDAIDVVVNKKNSQLQFDRTIDCVIEEVKNLTTGEYKVRYLDEAFSAYAVDGANYKIGRIVQVLIPQNDMSQRKTILNEKKSNIEDIEEVIFNEERYSPVGLPFEKIYFNETDSNDLAAKGIVNKCFEEHSIYGSHYSKKINIFKNDLKEEILSSEDINYNAVFRNYAKDQTMLMITADFKTRWLYETVLSGEYGLEFIFENIEENGEDFKYYITSLDLIGNPYKKINYSPTNFVFSIEGNKIKSLKEINLYSRYFKRQNNAKEEIDSKIAEEDLLKIWNDGKGMSEIFVKNISMTFCQETQLEGYSVQVVYPRGQYASLANGLQLKAEVRHNGVLIENISSFEYYWFKRNIQISLGHEKYNEIGGIGWELIPNENNNIYSNINLNSNEIAKEFKAVVICDDIKISNTGILYREFSKEPQGQLILSHDGQGGGSIEAILNNYNIEGLTYHWLKEDSFGIIENLGIFTNNKINIVTSNIINYNIYRCQIIKGTVEIITLEIYVYDTKEDKEYDVIFKVSQNGTYLYDTAGDLYPAQKFQEPITSQSIDFNIPQNIGDFSYKWIFPDINNSLILSTNGLLEGNNRTNGGKSSIEFIINDRYDYTKAINNQVELQITTNKQSKSFYYDLSFIKEGEPGTNGTSLVMRIKYADGSAKALHNNSQKVGFQADIFYNGINVTNEFNLIPSIPKDYKENNPLEENYFKYNSGSNIIWIEVPNNKSWLAQNYNCIFQIIASPKNNEQFPYKLIGLQAVPFTTSSLAINLLPKGISQVVYAADGYSPSYPKIPYDFSEWASGIELIGVNCGELKDNLLKPKEQYLGKDTHGAIKFVNATGNMYIYPIVYMANAFSKELLNAWDGASVQIDNEGGSILAPQIGAGKKDDNNLFTGVLMGAYIGGDDSSAIHGLYGFNKGVTSFGFLEDGTAFIGQANKGRLLFDGEKSIITSSMFAENMGGMELDFDKGKITLNSPNEGLVNTDAGSILIDAEAKTYPLTVGENFKVKWDGSIIATSGEFTGTITATSGEFTGTINAKAGEIGGWNINDTTITAGNTTLNSNGTITTSNLIMNGGSINWSAINEEDSSAYQTAESAESIAKKIANGTYSGGTFIKNDTIYSPNIYTQQFTINPKDNEDSHNDTFILKGRFDGSVYTMFKIGYGTDIGPYTTIENPSGGPIKMNAEFDFQNVVDFTNATVIGLESSGGTATAVFG